MAAAVLIFVDASLISGSLFFHNRVVTVPCASHNHCAIGHPGQLFEDHSGFRTDYHSLWVVVGTFVPLVILLGTAVDVW